MIYPVVVVRLMDKLKAKGVGQDAEWGSLLEKTPLRHADDLDSATLSHAVDIFVKRHHLLWKPVWLHHLLLLTSLRMWKQLIHGPCCSEPFCPGSTLDQRWAGP